jgi:hypothetical protein
MKVRVRVRVRVRLGLGLGLGLVGLLAIGCGLLKLCCSICILEQSIESNQHCSQATNTRMNVTQSILKLFI